MKIVRLILLLICEILFLQKSVLAQQDFSAITLRIRNPKDAMGVASSSGNTAFIFEGHKQYHISLLDITGKEIKNYIANRTSQQKKEIIIGAVLTDSSYTAYFYSKRYGSFSSLVFDLPTGRYIFNNLLQMSGSEQFLRAFTMNEHFYILTVPKQKNVLNVYEASDGVKTSGGSYPVEMTTFYANLSSNNTLLNEAAESAVGIETVRTRLDNNIKSAYPKKKLYYENNKIYLSFDEPNSTHLVIIDLDDSKCYYKKLNFALSQGNNSADKRGNSFLYDNKVFRATISPDMMNISIIDLDSIRLINSYNIYPEQDISIANGPILQEGGTNSMMSDERILHKTKQYFNRVLAGNISIAANRTDSGMVEVEVGSYEEIVMRSGGNGFGTPGFSLGMGSGMGMGMGGYGMGGFGSPYGMGGGFGSPFGYGSGFGGYPGYYPFGNSNSSVRLRIVSFKTLLQDPYYIHAPGNIPKTLREKINSYIESRFAKHSPELYTITSYNEKKLLLGYYMRNTNKFEVVAFDKIYNTTY